MSKIFIDPGHGGSDSGAVSNGLIEKDINLIVAKEVKRLLEEQNVKVLMSREGDTYPSLDERASKANSFKADYFISIHHNAGGGNGYEIIHSVSEGKGKELSEKIGSEFESIGQTKRRIYFRTNSNGKDYFAVIRQTNMPAIITEFAFLDSSDKDIIDTKEKLLKEAKGIANGILRQLNLSITQPVMNQNNDFEIAVKKLADKGIIQSPEYWIKNDSYKTEYVRELIKRFVNIV